MSTLLERTRRRLADESGAVVVIFALLLIVLFGAVAFAVDLSRLYHERQVVQNAVDFGSLAGAGELPAQGAVQGAAAAAEALRVTMDNAPGVVPANIAISFRCIVGDRDGDGAPDFADVPYVCGPTAGTWSAGGWRTRRGKSIHACNPYAGDKCNTISVQTSSAVDYAFAPVIGVDRGNTGAVNAASCKGACGAAPAPLDVVMVIDRTGSMTVADLANAKNAAVSVLDFYDSSTQWVGVVALPYGQPGNPCDANNPQLYPQGAAINWQVSPLSRDYDRADGTLNTSSQILQNINCLKRAGSLTVKVNGVNKTGGHTNLGDPLDAAREMLLTQGRLEVPDVIIFMTDGEANQPEGYQPCSYLNGKATIAKAAGQTIYTIGYGVASARCTKDTAGTFQNAYASLSLAAAATSSTDNLPGGCAVTENKDGDNYFCESGSADLEPVFRQVAAASVGSARLVDDF